MGSLIDSSIYIAAERGDPALRLAMAVLPVDEGDLFISAVTVFELLHGVHRSSTEKRAREAFVENALQTFPILAFDETAARIFASINAPLSAAGNRLPVDDLMIAATALANGHEVVTRGTCGASRGSPGSNGSSGRREPRSAHAVDRTILASMGIQAVSEKSGSTPPLLDFSETPGPTTAERLRAPEIL